MNDDARRSRRDFLKTGAAGIAGAALGVGCSRQRLQPDPPIGEQKPAVRTLGRTGLELPVVSMGSIYAIGLVQTALDNGIKYIHTSSGYAERNHERLLGEVFRGRPRDSFVVATSPDLPYRPMPGRSRSMGVGTDVDPDLISGSIEGSLERLNVDRVDIYYLVSVASRETVLFEPYMRVFEKLKSNGQIRFAGVGTHSNEPEVIKAAAESGFWDVILTAYNFRQSHREAVRSALAEAAEAGLGVVAMKTQAGVYWDKLRTRKINMKAALKWVLQDENVHTTIPAFATFDEMFEDLSIMDDLTLTPEEWSDLGLGTVLGLSGLYCQQCGDCLEQCPAGMDLPTLMRAHMYAVGHAQPRKARELLDKLTGSEVSCLNCAKCEAVCSLGHDLRSRCLEIAQLLEIRDYA
jgi:predicted aldo/keto reductase-like oxidoreductase